MSNVTLSMLTDAITSIHADKSADDRGIMLAATIRAIDSQMSALTPTPTIADTPAPMPRNVTRTQKAPARKTTAKKAAKSEGKSTWEMTVEERMARYNGQSAFWNGKASKPQIKRVTETATTYGWELDLDGMLAFEAAECYAMMMADAKGVAFTEITSL